MLYGSTGKAKTSSLMAQYGSLLSEAVLRDRARVAEHAARIETELASKVKSEFISNMSHELRTPLNTVIGFSKLLTQHGQKPLADKNIVEYAGLINGAAEHLLSVINDILDISKIQSGRYTLDAQEVDVEAILASAISAFKTAASDAGVRIDWIAAFDLPSIRGNAAKLRQIFANIVSNAVKFTPAGGAIKIEAIRTNTNGVVVIVHDTGVGMTADEISIALTPFGQVDGGRNRWREGAGLGLPIAKALVELHGGILELRSKKGHGTDVVIALPAKDAVSEVTTTQFFAPRRGTD